MKLLLTLLMSVFLLTVCSDKSSDVSGLVSIPADEIPELGLEDVPAIINAFNFTEKTYGLSQNIEFSITFNKVITISSGSPKLVLDIGGSLKDALLVSGSGTNQFTFSYTTIQ